MSLTPEPPPYGTPPPTYAPPPQQGGPNRTVDRTLSWILYVLQVLGSLAMGLISLFAIFLTDSCGTGSSDPMVCDTDYFGSVIIGYWIALVVLIVATPIAMVVATTTKRAVWPWALGGSAMSVIATVVFFVLISR
ncbi:MAG: hypothetical protein JWQ70_3134 [Aeromicrobium sp.]|nr:hypothetical protein [Aeromicrobium sp.]